MAYVSDQPNNQLVMVDLAAGRQIGSVALGESPEGVSLSADGRWVAVATEESNDVVFVGTWLSRPTERSYAWARDELGRPLCTRPGRASICGRYC